jgi:DNA recombination protein RmuC
MDATTFGVAVGALLVGALVAWIVASEKLRRLEREKSVLETTLAKEREAHAEKFALLADAKERLTLEFKNLAAGILADHSTKFTQQNKEQVGQLLDPLRERIAEFKTSLDTAHTETKVERATLAEQIKNLTSTSAAMANETTNLTRALKGDLKTQGAWGEMLLESILERSGLREGEEYEAQSSYTNEEGRRVIPDFLVKLPNDQKIVVDSKVSLKAFETYVNAEDEADRAAALQAHVASVRNHIKILSEKDYHLAVGSHLDYVIMFMPIEGALAAVLQADPALTSTAIDQNVAIATPTTLMVALRTIANVWQVERRNQNAEKIAERAGRLYDKFVGFVEDMQDLGNRLNQAQSSYDGAMKKLTSGTGNLARQVGQLKAMGAKAAKSLPDELADDNDEPYEGDSVPDEPPPIALSSTKNQAAE